MKFKNQVEFNTSLKEALAGNRIEQARLKEAITSDQLAPMFIRAADVRFQEAYEAYETIWSRIAEKFLLNDFRKASLLTLKQDLSDGEVNGGMKTPFGTLPKVPELTSYPMLKYTADGAFVTTDKHGARLQFSFEAFINDDWNLIERFPKDAGELAARTEDLLVLLQLFDTNLTGLRADVFTDDNQTKIDLTKVPDDLKGSATGAAGAVPLSFDAVVAARHQAIATIRDGRPTYVPNGFILVTNPALAEVAKGYARISEVRVTNGRRTEIQANPLADLEVVTSDLIVGTKAWVLVPKGGKAGSKSVLVKTGMRGREAPELRVHNATGQLLGGGAVDYREGSFDNDDAEIRVRQIAGAGLVNYDGIIGSNGA